MLPENKNGHEWNTNQHGIRVGSWPRAAAGSLVNLEELRHREVILLQGRPLHVARPGRAPAALPSRREYRSIQPAVRPGLGSSQSPPQVYAAVNCTATMLRDPPPAARGKLEAAAPWNWLIAETPAYGRIEFSLVVLATLASTVQYGMLMSGSVSRWRLRVPT